MNNNNTNVIAFPQNTQAAKYENYFAGQYQKTAQKLERVLASDKVSREVKNIFEALVAEAAIEAGFSIPETDEIVWKFPKIFKEFEKSGDKFFVYFYAIETALNHGINEKEI